MKHKLIYLILTAVLIVSIVTGCSAQAVSENGTTESTAVSDESKAESDMVAQSAESASETTIGGTGAPASEQEEDNFQREATETTTKSGQNPANDRTGSSTTVRKQTTTKRQTTTKKQTTTTTTKRHTTTTTKKSGLSKSDVEWVQSQANAYIKSKGISVNSGVGSFSGKISSKNFSTRNDLLSYVKDEIDYEYDDCIASGWHKVEMYVKIESRTDGSYFLYVMYG